MRDTRGITLTALIVTIIVLLILAGITISQLTGNGLFPKANQAKEKTEESNAREIIITKIYEYQLHELSSNKNPILEGLKEYYKEDKDIEYIDIYNTTNAKIKLKEYKYRSEEHTSELQSPS